MSELELNLAAIEHLNLYPFQKSSAIFHAQRRYSMNCSEMGLGKSRMALAAALLVGAKEVAVFAPAFLRGTWEVEGAVCGVKIQFMSYSILTSITALEWEILSHKDFWIFDEASYLKNPMAKRTKALNYALRTYRPGYLVMLTGTPIRNKAFDFWTLLAYIDANPIPNLDEKKLAGALRTYTGFANHFCNKKEIKLPGRPVIIKYLGLRDDRVGDLKELLRGKYIRHTIESVNLQLPEMINKDMVFDLKEMPETEEVFKAYMDGKKVSPTGKEHSARLKVPHTVAYIDFLFESEGVEQVVVFTDHVIPAQEISRATRKHGSFEITGNTAPSDRIFAVDQFQRGNIKILVCTIGSMSVGVTLTAAQDVIFNDLSWVPADNMQARKRIHRIGQAKKCRCHYIISGPTDAYIKAVLEEKEKTINQVMENTNG